MAMSAQPGGSKLTQGLRSLGRALEHRNYRLFFFGQGISLIGTWMSRIATGWLVFRLAGDRDAALLLGLVSFVGQSPSFFLTPFTGILVDRWNRHRLLTATQAVFGVLAALLSLVAFTASPGMGTIGLITLLSFLQGVVNAFDMPARQTFVIELLDRKEDLSNAIALNSSLVNGARLIGPSLAGVLIAVAGEGWCFLIDAISYIAVISSLLAMRIKPPPRQPHHAPVWQGIREGFAYAFGFVPIRTLLLLLALVSFMGMPYVVLLPIFAQDVLHGGPYALGFLSAASGVGALIGAVYLASRQSVLGLGRTIVIATSTFGVGLIGFALSPWLWLSLPVMLLIGFGMMVQMAASNTILQTIVDEDKRGRVMSFYSMAFLGMAPLGSLFAGTLANAIGHATGDRITGAVWTVLLGGVSCLLAALAFSLWLPQLREVIRPVYKRLGILPEVAAGMQTATELVRPPER